MDTDNANAEIEMDVVATVEVQNTVLVEKTNGGAKEIDYMLKEIDDAFKLREIDLDEKDEEGSHGMENPTDEESEKSEERYIFGTDADGTSGMEESMDKEPENNIEKYISPNVDSFCPKKMQISVEKNKIKINCGAIHQLLGVPCGDVTIESMGKLKKRDESVKAWRNRYSGNFVAPTELVSKIETSEDEDCFNFKIDFLMCFLAVMVECHGQGRCKEKILDKLIEETDFSKINWCAYILDSMKGCNKRLKERQKWEIENGGFGKGKFKRLSKVIVDEDEVNIGYSVGSSNDGNEGENDNYEDNEKNDKEETDKEGENDTSDDKEGENDTSTGVEEDQQEKPGDSEDNGVVDHDQQQPEVTNNHDQQQPEDTEENAGEENDYVQDSEANAGWKNDAKKGLGEFVESDTVTISLEHGEIFEINVSKDTAKEGNTEEEKTNEIVYDAPRFSIRLTQLESNNEELDTGKEQVDSQQGLSVRQKVDGSTLDQNKSEYVYVGPPFSIGVTKLESQYCAYETKQIEKSNMEKRSDEVESSDIREAIIKEEELVWGYLFKEDGMMYKLYGKRKRKLDDEEKIETVFRNNFNLEVEKFRFKTLKCDTKVFNNGIDAWVDVLNYEEKYRSPTSPYRLFCDTDLIFDKRMERFILNMNRVVYWNPALMDLRGIDMVVMPMLEHNHYYLIVFELKHIAISVIDNFSDAYPLVRLDDNENYFEKDSSYTVKEIFVKYLEHIKHPKTYELNATKIKKVKISWATTSNALDCEIFVMRHMEKYLGAKEEFNSGLSTNSPKKNKQLKIVRKKYAAHILLSECNKVREKIQIEALGK
ncbi:hypothetical protein L1987_78076 [Smallanthus sonchifolius]|uniref:Uncharacterized protein n=1 Tax=Smallanthus sonchifolius TaxID=185202 RepID=A0ACB8ZCP9_9ASTR|nr:hypothetical protein L1987_78076 [Smallanthus sonchifolius]